MKALGIDWGHKELCLALADERGRWITVERHPTHAMPQLLARLRDLGGPEEIAICVESGALLLCYTLRKHGYDVAEIAPVLARKLSDLHAPGGAKDDARDARTLAMARLHQQLGLTIEHVRDDTADALRVTCSMRDRFVAQRTRLMQQITSVLRSAHPGLAALDLDLRARFARRLIVAYADPQRAGRAQQRKVARLLRPARKEDLTAERVVQSLRGHGYEIPDHMARACALEVSCLVEQLELIDRHIEQADRKIERLLATHPDAEILASLPGVGATLSAAIAARIHRGVADTHSPKELQILAGTAPRTRISGKRSGGRVLQRTACDRNLHQALVQMARCSVGTCAWARAFVREHTGGRPRDQKRRNKALRALANKWVRIIHRMLVTRTTYDEARHCRDLRRNAVPWAPPAENTAA